MSVPVIVGGGLAGLACALALAPRPVILLGRKSEAGLTSSELAQGGIAAALGADDTSRLHEQDTLTAGAGLCDPAIVKMLAAAAPQAIERLSIWGVAFDRTANHDYVLGLEGAHSRRRIVHANGDSTGAAVMEALIAKVRATPSIGFVEDAELQEIQTDDLGVCGITFAAGLSRRMARITTRHVVMATGSACGLWRHTTVPSQSWGHGLLIAARAGARLRDMEFVQFHPTSLDCGLDPMPLISEALRGEGALLVNDKGDSFVGELNPRDVVARAIWAQSEKGRKVYLDVRHIKNLADRFPTVLQACVLAGLDPRETLIPVRPVAHYSMGGIATDAQGQTNVSGLYACGEAACTGLHGANRLASNSLLEAVVMGCRIADLLKPQSAANATARIDPVENGAAPPLEMPDVTARARYLMTAYVGARRQKAGLEEVIGALENLRAKCRRAEAGLMVARAALARTESRGAHDRADYPDTDAAQARPLFVTLENDEIKIDGEKT